MPVPMPARRPRRPGSIAKARANRHACVSRLCFMGNALMENRHGLLVETRHGLAVAATPNCATGTAGRAAALALVDDLQPASGATPGADNACDAWRFKAGLRERGVVPHMAGRSDRSWGGLPVVEPAGYQSSQRARKRVEETFASVKTIAGQSRTVFKTVFKTIFRGRPSGGVEELRHPSHWRLLAVASYNLIRLPKLPEQGPSTGHKCVHNPLRSPKWPSRRPITRPQTRTYGCPKPKSRRSKSFFNSLLRQEAFWRKRTGS